MKMVKSVLFGLLMLVIMSSPAWGIYGFTKYSEYKRSIPNHQVKECFKDQIVHGNEFEPGRFQYEIITVVGKERYKYTTMVPTEPTKWRPEAWRVDRDNNTPFWLFDEDADRVQIDCSIIKKITTDEIARLEKIRDAQENQ